MTVRRGFSAALVTLLFSLAVPGAFAPEAFAQGPPPHVRKAIQATEAMLISEGREPLETYLDETMNPSGDRDREAWIEHLAALRTALRDHLDGVMVEKTPDGLLMILSGGGEEKRLEIALGPDGVSDLALADDAPDARAGGWGPVEPDAANFGAIVDRLEADGLSGVAYLKIGDHEVVRRGFGMADRSRGVPNTPDKIFGVGSRPIDFTIAAIQLLAQQGKLGLDDPIAKHFEGVPDDKRAMTVRHLMTGESGLPDFFDTEDDLDPDLGWVDRKTAERRLLGQTLMFAPGTDRSHSHGAFGLLAALVERVSGKSYYAFIREHFLDPAGMTRTGEYGESRGLTVDDFAVGRGNASVGIPNIPPNWGPTSWLVKGSGGMYSTLDDLRRFYAFVRSGKVLDEEHRKRFETMSAHLDGSERGYELFSLWIPPDRELYLFFNEIRDFQKLRGLFRDLNRALAPETARMETQTD